MKGTARRKSILYVKQNLNDDQLTVKDIQEMIANGDKHIADRIMRFGKGLCRSR